MASAEPDPPEEFDSLWIAYLAGWASLRPWSRVPTPELVAHELRESLALDAYRWIYRH